MFKSIKNNKGFTLIELLAVIVILGILMIVAIPQVTKYIEQSKKDTFIDTAKACINAARYAYLNDEYTDITGCTLGSNARIPLSKLEVDNAGKSSFGGELDGYVTIIVRKDDKGAYNDNATHYTYEYYITIKDQSKKWTISGPEKSLKRQYVKQIDDTIAGGTISCGDSIEAPTVSTIN